MNKAHTTLAAATAARQRGEANLAAAEQELKRLEEKDAANIERHAARLANWTRDGHTGVPPVLVPDPAHEQAVRTAQHSAVAARKALLTLAADETAAKQALAVAQRNLAQLRTARRRTECDGIAARLAHIRKEELRLVTKLFTAGAEALSPAAEAVLNSPPPRPCPATLLGGPCVPDINTPISGSARGDGINAAERFWQEFDAKFSNTEAAA